MKESDKTTNDKADKIIDVVNEMNYLKETDMVQYINYNWDEGNNIFQITTVPKQAVEYIEVNLTITPTGTTFN